MQNAVPRVSATQKEQLERLGYCLDAHPLPERVREALRAHDWVTLDRRLGELLQPTGGLWHHLQQYLTFESVEYILSVRDSADPDQEDGIWHDDGSRRLACTLSLTEDAIKLEGGCLGIRPKGGVGVLLPTPPLGELIVYQTGVAGYEHKIHRVTAGCRVVAALWLS
ncbi:MAG: 2OG-Fe(II) oxygenase [Myxococcota bacterium]